ncbi:hypothetical protein BIW11_02836 [Tropilaelaps mercedesae]|uniref:Uncharacterized protein n=1 Tax=Tropilaelaps mercedesae TaxID=418985 RepID=A0A1V9XWK6_9ACAR|nr:hypothetical protein BIW11_02836 [Tropilaelaps mercedesae]
MGKVHTRNCTGYYV